MGEWVDGWMDNIICQLRGLCEQDRSLTMMHHVHFGPASAFIRKQVVGNP